MNSAPSREECGNSAPWRRRACTVSGRPYCAAYMRAVQPFSSLGASTSAPAFSSLSTKAAWPFSVAALKAVCVPAGVFTGAPRASNKSTTSVWPFATALINAVKPFAS